MYHWLSDKDYLKKLKSTCGGLVNELVQLINVNSRIILSTSIP